MLGGLVFSIEPGDLGKAEPHSIVTLALVERFVTPNKELKTKSSFVEISSMVVFGSDILDVFELCPL
jgi:hypothetical protein